jgi:hypothetical protein
MWRPCVLILALAAPLLAQVDVGGISGVITDSTGAVIP